MTGTGQVAKATWRNRTKEHVQHGAKLRGQIMGVPRPPVVGVSDAVALSNAYSSRAAAEAMREWRKSLPKGVRI